MWYTLLIDDCLMMETPASSNALFIVCRIPLEPVYLEGSLPETAYNVVKDEEYRGEIKISLKFSPEVALLYFCQCCRIIR